MIAFCASGIVHIALALQSNDAATQKKLVDLWKNETGYLKMWKNRNHILGTPMSARGSTEAPRLSVAAGDGGGGSVGVGTRRRGSSLVADGDGGARRGGVGRFMHGHDGLISLEELSSTLKQLDAMHKVVSLHHTKSRALSVMLGTVVHSHSSVWSKKTWVMVVSLLQQCVFDGAIIVF